MAAQINLDTNRSFLLVVDSMITQGQLIQSLGVKVFTIWLGFIATQAVAIEPIAAIKDNSQVGTHSPVPRNAASTNSVIATLPTASIGNGSNAEPDKDSYSWRDTTPAIKGQLVYAFDNANYGSGGFAWPWNSFLVFHNLTPSPEQNNLGRKKDIIISYSVETPRWDFLYEPQFSPDGKFILFKVGNPNSSFGTYQPYLWNLESKQLTRIVSGLHHRSILWSSDSRYLAYVSDAIQPPGGGAWVNAKLCIYNLQTNEDHVVTENEPILGSMAWAPNKTLLFSQMPPPLRKRQPIGENKNSDSANINSVPTSWLPDIYETSATGGEPHVLIHEGFRPMPSPDGKWIAFFGFTDPSIADKPPLTQSPNQGQSNYLAQKPAFIYLLLANRASSNRKLIRREIGGWSSLRWTPDSRQIIILKWISKNDMSVEVHISKYDLPTQKETPIGVTEYKVRPGTDLSEDNPLLRPIQVSNDGKYLFFQLLQFEAMPNNGLFLKAVNLEDGTVSTLCRIGSVRGLDWHDESTPIAAQLPK